MCFQFKSVAIGLVALLTLQTAISCLGLLGDLAFASEPVSDATTSSFAQEPGVVKQDAIGPRAVEPRVGETDAQEAMRAEHERAELRAELGRQAAAIAELQRETKEQTAPTSEVKAERNALTFSAYLQFDWVVYDQKSQPEVNFATGQPQNDTRFLLRRGRFRAESATGRTLGGGLEFDANTQNGLQLRPINAELWLTSPWKAPELPRLTLSAGLLKIPFGFEVPERETARPFLERSTLMRALFPGAYDLGVNLKTTYRLLSLTLGVMNGHPIGDRVFPALAPLARKELIAHLQLETTIVPEVLLAVGASVDSGTGFHSGTPTSKNQLVWRDDNGDGLVSSTEVQVLPGSSATPSRSYKRFALGVDGQLEVRWAPGATTTLRSELVRASNLDRALELADPIGAGYQLRELGWYVGLTQQITEWGLLGIRYDSYDPDQDAREQRADQTLTVDRRYRTLALLAALRYESARLAVEYNHNRNALGRALGGAPSSLQSDTLTLRAQVQF